MSSKPRLAVHGLWKRFRPEKRPGGRLLSHVGGTRTEHWALRNLNFNIPAGGALGVIGANGSGKSTLLQLVAGVLHPTQGTIHREGRVVAILNPTAGFHPDLTGRANIRMLATLHGFHSRDISRCDAATSSD